MSPLLDETTLSLAAAVADLVVVMALSCVTEEHSKALLSFPFAFRSAGKSR
jgi:hypothetical protein